MTDLHDELPAISTAAAAGALPELVVGLGASAGGIKALAEFFARVPPDAPVAYVVILHLSPEHDSQLAEVLQQSAAIPVVQVRAPVALERARAYVIPPNQSLQVKDGGLLLSPITSRDERRAPVDVFFRTLASAYGARAAAVVLSGTGPNGSSGLKRVKENGGLTIAQNPLEAEYNDMPVNAIATGLVDYVLPVGEMPAHLVAYQSRLHAIGVQGQLEPSRQDGDDEVLREILTLLRARTGHDFTNYKTATVRRRIARRLSVRAVGTLPEYARFIRAQPDEALSLMKELLISVTSFFRDPASFEALERRVMPRLFEGRRGMDHLRVWSAGCATGEEAYALAMLLAEQADALEEPPTIQVFGSDLDEHAIAVAREGVYSEAEVADVPADRLQRFFQREAGRSGRYRVRRELREMVLFAHHNVITDPPFSHVDLIACRNLLIYLNRSVQARLLETFHFALNPGGYLFLGGSEMSDEAAGLFAAVDNQAHIYESVTAAGRRATGSPVERPAASSVTAPRLLNQKPGERIPSGELHLRLLEEYAAPSIVVDEDHAVVHVSPGAARLLQVPGGEPTRDLFRLVHPDLRVDLRTAFRRAIQVKTMVEVRGVTIAGATDSPLRLVVRPVLRSGTRGRGYFLVLFEPDEGRAPEGRLQLSSLTSLELPRVDEELSRLTGELRAKIEQYDTQVEESKSANEELQAMNAELRSSTGKLELSKEELQSVNEELTTVNQELKIKIEELARSNSDFHNLINSIEIGTIFLDRQLRVKLAAPRAREVFNLLPSDVGRRLTDITSRLAYDGLVQDVNSVLDHLQVIEREVPSRDGLWYQIRLVPYRTSDDRIDGVVLTFQDTTARREAEMRVRSSEERLRFLIDSAIDYAIFSLTEDGGISSWNSGAQRMFGYTAEEITGQAGAILFTPEDRAAGIPAEELRRARKHGRALDERWHLRRDGSRLYCSGVTTRIGAAEGLGFAKIARDLTAQREAEDRLKDAYAQLEAHVQQRTADLRGEIARRTASEEHATALLGKLVTAQEEQRARIARDLHDQLGQQLTALRLALEQCQTEDGPASQDSLERALVITRRLDSDLEFLTWELRPAVLGDLGLATALPRFLEEWSAQHQVPAHFHTSRFDPARLSAEAEVTSYRIAQAALNNVAKHAQASRVDIVLEGHDEGTVLIIEDDGIGFEPSDRERGFGILGMQERAGLIGASLQIESSPGKGTTILLRVPNANAASPPQGTLAKSPDGEPANS